MEPEAPLISHPFSHLVLVGFILVFIGFILIFLGFVAPLLSGARAPSGGGAVIIVGPLPVVIASNERIARALLILAIILVILVFALFFLTPYLLARAARVTAGG